MSREALGSVVGDFKVLFSARPKLGAKFNAKSRIWIYGASFKFHSSAVHVSTGNRNADITHLPHGQIGVPELSPRVVGVVWRVVRIRYFPKLVERLVIAPSRKAKKPRGYAA